MIRVRRTMGLLASLLGYPLIRGLDIVNPGHESIVLREGILMKAKWRRLSARLSMAVIFFLLAPVSALSGKILLSFVFLALYLALLRLEQRLPLTVCRNGSKYYSFFCFLAVFGFFLVVFFPGGMITDSHYLFSMAYTGKFHSYRSRFLALIYQLLFLIHKSTVPILVAQLFLYATAIALLVRRLLENRLLVTAFLVLGMAFMPMFAGPVGVLCENSWIFICYLFGILLLCTTVRRNFISRGMMATGWLFFCLAFFTRSYDVLTGLPLFLALFYVFFLQAGSRKAFLHALVLTGLMLVGQIGTIQFIDKVKATNNTRQNEKFMNFYRALPVPFDADIKLPMKVRSAIEEHLRSKSEGWRAMNDLGKYSILEEGRSIDKEGVVSEIVQYARKKPDIFLKAYWAQFVHLLVIPHSSNWVVWTTFHPEHKLNKLNYPETTTVFEKMYVHYSNFHLKYAYIYQPIAIFLLSTIALLLAISRCNRSSPLSLLFAGWAGSGWMQVLVNLLLAYHGAYRLYHWSAVSGMLIILLIQSRRGLIISSGPGPGRL